MPLYRHLALLGNKAIYIHNTQSVNIISAPETWVNVLNKLPSSCLHIFADISLETYTR